MSKRYLNEKQVSEITGRSVSSLRHDRTKGAGLPYIRIPGQRRIYYDEQDVHAIMEQHKIRPREARS